MIQLFRTDPPPFRALKGPRLPSNQPAVKTVQANSPVGVPVLNHHPFRIDLHLNPKFFLKFSLKRSLQPFPGVHFPSREFPIARERSAEQAPGDQKSPLMGDHPGRHN